LVSSISCLAFELSSFAWAIISLITVFASFPIHWHLSCIRAVRRLLRLALQASYPQWYSRNLDMLLSAVDRYKVNMAHLPRSAAYKGGKDVVCHANHCHLDCTSSLGKIILISLVAQGRSCKVSCQKKALLVLQNFAQLATTFSLNLIRDRDDFCLQVSAEGSVDLGRLELMLDASRLRRRPAVT
jgi:hypothetical protein